MDSPHPGLIISQVTLEAETHSPRNRCRQRGLLCSPTMSALCCVSTYEQMPTLPKPSLCIFFFSKPPLIFLPNQSNRWVTLQNMSSIGNWKNSVWKWKAQIPWSEEDLYEKIKVFQLWNHRTIRLETLWKILSYKISDHIPY